jgi:hypothetical protein
VGVGHHSICIPSRHLGLSAVPGPPGLP